EAGQVGDIDGMPGNMAGTGGGHRARLFAQQIVHDREIVDGKVPEHIDVVLEETKIDPHRVVVVKASEAAAVDQLADPLHGAGVDERVVHHQHAVEFCGGFDQGGRLLGACGQRFGDQHVLAGAQGGHRQVEVGRDRCDDDDGIHRRAGEDLVAVGGRLYDRMAQLRLGQPLETPVADHRDLESWDFREVTNQVRPPVAV